MSTPFVRTVLGDVDPGSLGVVDYHDHLFQITDLLPGDELDDEVRSSEEAADLVDTGVSCLVEATPMGLGAEPFAVARIARARGLHVVHTTGVHREAHYRSRPDITSLSTAWMAERFRTDLTAGFTPEPPLAAGETGGVRAGLIKFGIGYWSLTPFERRALEAVGSTSREVGAPVMVHLEYGTATHEVLDLLESHGCPPERVALAHIDRNPDPGLHCELAARGAYLGYDGCARTKSWPDSVLIDCMARVVDGGGGSSILLGGDVARSTRYLAYGGMPGLAYTYRRFLPRVRAVVGDDAATAMTITNPARWLTWSLGEDQL
ncbi:phosphotriesterase [uncultured Tessaracoccus sp.]|uniref:phosphotriesterase family protein n=1 Tax=uncultured Tessaracoccus sp. TaxID=905023 RepID=UPI00263449A9|nr:hypothetical protein [uncultured Tessaracoccus sp.]